MKAADLVWRTATSYLNSDASNMQKLNSLLAVDLVQMAKAHIVYVVFKSFRHEIEHSIKCPQLKENMTNLAKLYALHDLVNDNTSLYDMGFLSAGAA